MPPYRGGALDFLHAALVAVRELLHAADLWRGGACGGEVRWTFCMPHLLLCGNFCMPLSGAGEGRWTFCMPCVVKRLV